MRPTLRKIKSVLKAKDMKFFSRPWSINIVGIRVNADPNTFDDVICVFFYDDMGKSHIYYFKCTTTPGVHWLLNPLNTKGTAIMVPGQYRGLYKIGIHNRSRPSRSYEALEQKGVAKYYRDNNKDGKLDFVGPIYEGNNKTNIHRAAVSGWSKFIDKWSAGCQVITGKHTDTVTNYDKFMELCKLSAERYGNSFTYTLLTSDDFT